MLIPVSLCSNTIFLQTSQWTFFPTLLCLLLYSLWDNFSHPLVMCCRLSPFFPHNLRRGAFTGLIDMVLHIVCSCAPRNNDFVSTFKSLLDNQCHVFSLSTFSVVSLMNYLCIRFPLNFSFSSFAFCFLNSTLIIVSLVLIVSAVNTPLIRFSFELAA